MKKNLRNILTLALGFVTVIATAQSWDADSRTRVDMGGDNDRFQTEQRMSLGASWGGDGWGINASGTANYALDGTGSEVDFDFSEVSATTDLMGWATVTVGRQAMNYGSGLMVGSNDWGANPYTRDGGTFAIDNDMVDLDFVYYRNNDGTPEEDNRDHYLINAAKSDGDWSMNALFYSDSEDQDAMGLDFGYAMMGGDIDLSVSYNSASVNDIATGEAVDMDMTSFGATYNVSDNISISASQTTYGDNGFAFIGSNYGLGVASWATHGNMGYLMPNDEDLAFGVNYASGDFTLGVNVHSVTNEEYMHANGDDYDRSVTEVSLNYNMSDNANVGIKYATDEGSWASDVDGNSVAAAETKYMWLTLNITP